MNGKQPAYKEMPMAQIKVHTRKCIVCSSKFEVSGTAAGRAQTCPPPADCRRRKQRKHEENSRKRRSEHWNPWLWENTILEWNE